MTKTELKKPTYKRVISAICLTLSVLLFVFAAYIAIASTIARSKGEQPSVFGFYFSIVITDSMSGEIEVGELIIYHSAEISEVDVGENIVFTALSGPVAGLSVVHKAIEIGEDSEGIYVITQGVNNDIADRDYVRADNLRGIVMTHSAFLGTIVSFFSNIVNVVIFFVVLLAVVIAIQQIIKILKYLLTPDDTTDAVDNPTPDDTDPNNDNPTPDPTNIDNNTTPDDTNTDPATPNESDDTDNPTPNKNKSPTPDENEENNK